ncbi:MAG: CHAD domain-containing protein, partial [Gluconacetobacter diazotrophicus]|nr:CHAD domain-containing protein [Gluconacetobacter diazotrophicus]
MAVLDTLAGATGKPPPEIVHAARKDLKRLRALLRLARAGLGEATFRRENAASRDAGRELSPVRDAQVLVQAFDALKAELRPQVAPETLATVDGWLRDGVAAALAALDHEDRRSRAAAALSAVRARVEAWPWERGENAWRVPGRGLRKTYRAARRAMRRAAKSGAAGDFHEWRKQVKHLGAHVGLLRPLSPERSRAAARRLGKLADLLGDEHDLAVLADTLARPHEPALPPADRAAIDLAIGERRARLRGKALARGRRQQDRLAARGREIDQAGFVAPVGPSRLVAFDRAEGMPDARRSGEGRVGRPAIDDRVELGDPGDGVVAHIDIDART